MRYCGICFLYLSRTTSQNIDWFLFSKATPGKHNYSSCILIMHGVVKGTDICPDNYILLEYIANSEYLQAFSFYCSFEEFTRK